jgi:hypothetical protein
VLKIWNVANFRRTTAGLCLLAAPALFFAALIVTPQPSGSAAAQLGSFAQHRGPLLAGNLVGIASAILFVPALFGLLHQIRTRGVVYAHIAGILVVYSLVVAAALAGVNLMFWEMTKPGMNRAAMISLLDGIEHQPVAAPLLAGHYLFVLGIILLAVALWRAGIRPRWAAILVALAPVLAITLTPAGALASGLVSGAIGVTGFAALGLGLLTEPDAVWDQRTPVPAEPARQPHLSPT